MTGIRKSNGYIGAAKALKLAKERAYFQRYHNKTGGEFVTPDGIVKINEKTFQAIKENLKPRI